MTTDPHGGWLPAGVTADDGPALQELADAGIGEGDFGGHPHVPYDAMVAYQAMEWANAVAHAAGEPLPHPDIPVPPPDPEADQ
jgi:hypothetical protein